MAQNDWMNDPRLNGLDKSKLALLQSLADQGSKKSRSELLPFLMSAVSAGKSQGAPFKQDEIQLILEVLKMGKSPEEQARLDQVMSLMSMMRK